MKVEQIEPKKKKIEEENEMPGLTITLEKQEVDEDGNQEDRYHLKICYKNREKIVRYRKRGGNKDQWAFC